MVNSKGEQITKDSKYWFVELADEEFPKLIDSGEYTPDEVQKMKSIKKSVIDRLISDQLNLFYNEPRGDKLRLMIMQEDVMGFLRQAAGFTLGEADSARRAMGKKKLEYLLPFKNKFERAWDEKIGFLTEEVWSSVCDFAKYGFNKSHSVSYSIISMQCLKMMTDYREDYLIYQFFNNNKKKDEAVKLLSECNGNIVFPTISNPFDGFKIAGKSFNNIEVEEDDVPQDRSYHYASDVLSDPDIPKKYKSKMICRGVFDNATMNIKQLAKIWADYSSKIHGCLNFPSTNSVKEIIEALSMMGACEVKYENGVMNYRKISPRSKKVIEFDTLRNSMDEMTEDELTYRATYQIKHLGVFNSNVCAVIPTEKLEVYEGLLSKLKNQVEDFISSHKEEYLGSTNYRTTQIGKVFGRYYNNSRSIDKIVDEGIYSRWVMEKVKGDLMKGKNREKFEKIIEQCTVDGYGMIVDKVVTKSYIKLVVQFCNVTLPIYIRTSDREAYANSKYINKKNIIFFKIKPDYYINKKKEIAVNFRITPVVQGGF